MISYMRPRNGADKSLLNLEKIANEVLTTSTNKMMIDLEHN